MKGDKVGVGVGCLMVWGVGKRGEKKARRPIYILRMMVAVQKKERPFV